MVIFIRRCAYYYFSNLSINFFFSSNFSMFNLSSIVSLSFQAFLNLCILGILMFVFGSRIKLKPVHLSRLLTLVLSTMYLSKYLMRPTLIQQTALAQQGDLCITQAVHEEAMNHWKQYCYLFLLVTVVWTCPYIRQNIVTQIYHATVCSPFVWPFRIS